MKILYDHQIFGSQKFGGISRYFVELMSRLPADIDFSNSITVTDNVYIKSAGKSVSKGIEQIGVAVLSVQREVRSFSSHVL